MTAETIPIRLLEEQLKAAKIALAAVVEETQDPIRKGQAAQRRLDNSARAVDEIATAIETLLRVHHAQARGDEA